MSEFGIRFDQAVAPDDPLTPGFVRPELDLPVAAELSTGALRLKLAFLFLCGSMGLTCTGLAVSQLLTEVTGSEQPPSQAQAGSLGFPDCNAVTASFVERGLDGTLYQCVSGEWVPVATDKTQGRQFSYFLLSRSFGLSAGPVSAVVHIRVERFQTGDVDAAVLAGLNQASMGQKVGWSEARRHFYDRGTYIRDFSGENWWDSTNGQ